MLTLTPLESSVIAALLAKSGEPYDSIRDQLAVASIVERRFTGSGFFTYFAIPHDSPVKRDLTDTVLGDVHADLPGTQYGAGFGLFVREGVVTMLEGYAHGNEAWPADVEKFTIKQYGSPNQSSDPVLSSGTSRAGHEPRHR